MSIMEKFERLMLAITFAEANEHEIAEEMLRERRHLRKRVRKDSRPQLRLHC